MLSRRKSPTAEVWIADVPYQAIKGRAVTDPALALLAAAVPDADPATLTANNLGLALLSKKRLVAASVLYAKPAADDPVKGVFYLADLAVTAAARGKGVGRALIQLTLASLEPGDLLIGHCPTALMPWLESTGLHVLPAGQPLVSTALGGAGLNYLPHRPHWWFHRLEPHQP